MTRHIWPDIWFTVVVEDVNDFVLGWRAYEIKSLDDDGPDYEKKGGDYGCGSATRELAEAQVFASGSLKWDGCMNMRFDAQEDDGGTKICLHFCHVEDALDIGRLLQRVYALGAERWPNHRENFEP